MKTLQGNTIYVGRDPNSNSLLVAVADSHGLYGTRTLAGADCPATVSRCIPEKKTGHCKIEVADDGSMRLVNLKDLNVTYVDSLQAESLAINPDSRLALGRDRHEVAVADILNAARKIVADKSTNPAAPVAKPAPKPKPRPKQTDTEERQYPLDALRPVWDSYHNAQLDLRRRQKKIALISGLSLPFSLVCGIISSMASRLNWSSDITIITLVLTILGFCVCLYGLILRARDNSIEEGERLTEEFQKRYVCPNPDCRHFLGNQSFNILRQSRKCPHCGAPFKISKGEEKAI